MLYRILLTIVTLTTKDEEIAKQIEILSILDIISNCQATGSGKTKVVQNCD